MTEHQQPGDVLSGRYRLLRQIGSGGMAAVYEGEDISLGRRIAVKMLHPHYSSDQSFVARFEREARAVAGLKHPSIVDVYDVGHDGDRYYIIMEFVEGQSVKNLVRAGPLLPDRVVDIGVQVAKALEHAHRAGVVHRDVKSHNILVSTEGATKLVDFGIAVAKGSASVTEAGTVLGTVHYIAPEQARGEPASPSSDIYSLGVVLFEMATGQLPFSGETAFEIGSKHVSEPPPRPSAINPRVPSNVERAILHALAKDPTARQVDAAEVAHELLSPPEDLTEQHTRVVEHPTEVVRQAREAAAPVTPRPAPRVERPVASHVVVEDAGSATWPIYILAALAVILVLGLIPLWSAVLRGG